MTRFNSQEMLSKPKLMFYADLDSASFIPVIQRTGFDALCTTEDPPPPRISCMQILLDTFSDPLHLTLHLTFISLHLLFQLILHLSFHLSSVQLWLDIFWSPFISLFIYLIILTLNSLSLHQIIYSFTCLKQNYN